MKHIVAALCALMLPAAASAATPVTHFAPTAAMPPGLTAAPGVAPPFSSAVMAGDTLYVSGTTDFDRATGAVPADPKAGAKMMLDSIKKTVESAGLTMNDMVWVQVFTSDVKYFAPFNEVYRTYFSGPLPARAFIGAGNLLGGAHFEMMGIAVRSKK